MDEENESCWAELGKVEENWEALTMKRDKVIYKVGIWSVASHQQGATTHGCDAVEGVSLP